jgi:plastocyanin
MVLPVRHLNHMPPLTTIDQPIEQRRSGRHALGLFLRLGGGLLAAAIILSACSGAPSTSSTGTTSAAHPAVHQAVTIENFAFQPANFTVRPGATITVTNRDSVTHTFTADNGAFNTGDIEPGRTRTVTAPEKPGRYPYRCLIHQFMTGTLTVR